MSTPTPDWYAQGYSAAKAGKYDEAMDDFQKVLAQSSRQAQALNMMGYCLRKAGRVTEAPEYYGEACLQVGDLKRAVQQYILLQKQRASQAKALLEWVDPFVNRTPYPVEDL